MVDATIVGRNIMVVEEKTLLYCHDGQRGQSYRGGRGGKGVSYIV